jgi:uncharacterized protein YecE (DUF72 family)
LGTCSWKYDSWQGIVYPPGGESLNHLAEYARHFDTVEVDQWFWSLFGVDKVKLPDAGTVEEYLQSVPSGFQFTVKVPNSITLTHFYTHGKAKSAPVEVNPHFFSVALFKEFLKRIEPLAEHIGVLMFQFEYLNRMKMPSQVEFLKRFAEFIAACPRNFNYAVETRNPNYLNERYFEFLNRHDLYHVFVQGYYMPAISEVYKKNSGYIRDLAVLRLMGSDRHGIEERAGNKWDAIIDPRDNELPDIVAIIRALEERKVKVYVNVNNHYEGSAPLTIKKIQEMLKK